MQGAELELVAGLSPSQTDAFMALGSSARLSHGSVLFTLGEPAESMYLVESGRMALTLPMRIAGEEEEILIEERHPGGTLGWSGLIPPHRFTLKATAQAESTLLSFPRSKLLEHFAAHPEVGFTVTRNVAAVIGHRLHVFQAMWLREMQRAVDQRSA